MRADYRCVSSAESGERYVWEQQLAGSPFERHLRALGGRDRAAGRGRGHRGHASPPSRRCAGMSRLGSPMMRGGQGKILDQALDGIERACGDRSRRSSHSATGLRTDGRESDSPRTATRSGGGGAIRGRAAARRRGPGDAARAGRRAGAVRRWRRSRARSSFPTPSRCRPRWSRRSARPRRLHVGPRIGCDTRPAAAMPTSPGCARAARRGPRRRRARRRRRPPAPRPRNLRGARASPSSPSAAAPASSAASSRCAARTARLISLDLGAPARRRGRPALADRDARRRAARPEAEAALNRRGRRARPPPAVLRVRDVGGFAATRSAGQASSGYGRFDALVSSVRLIAPAGRCGPWRLPTPRPGPALRELIVGSEGTSG